MDCYYCSKNDNVKHLKNYFSDEEYWVCEKCLDENYTASPNGGYDKKN